MSRVLLVDDHQIVRRGLRQLLADAFAGIEFGEASSLPEARESLALGAWDLLILDLNLPGGSGLQLLEESRRSAPDTPVIVLTSYPEEEFAVRAFRLGASGYITKAAVVDELVVAARKALDGGKYVTPALAERLADAIGATAVLPHELLSVRELEVLQLVARGRSLKEVAAELGLSEKTVATYRSRLAAKLRLSSNVELARYAVKHGLVE